MWKIINKIRVCTVLLAGALLAPSCNSWLDLMPENDQTSDMYWKTKEDVEAVVVSGYIRMKSCLEDFLQWGELRGNGLTYTGSSAVEQNIIDLEIQTDNSVADWYNIYRVIASANAVIRYAPTVMTHDETFLEEVMKSYVAEATFQRSLCYFYLLRTFHEVPLVLDPYVDDSAPYNVPKSTEREIIDRLTADLEACVRYARPGFGTAAENKGRATRWAIYSLLADICLWDGQYDKCIAACNQVLTAGQAELLPAKRWFELYYPGNSVESIFELNYDQATLSSDKNELFNWSYGDKPKYRVSQNTIDLLAEEDMRGLGGSFSQSGLLWKYAGLGLITVEGALARGSEERDAHWIFYRLADICLMKAEALVMSANGNQQLYNEAIELVNVLRRRAGITTDLAAPSTEDENLELVLNERQVEFVGEGKRWFDILRVAKRDDYKRRAYLVNILLDGLSAQDRPTKEQLLADENGYFLPVLQKEIDNSGGVLIQNPYYRGQE